VAEVSPTGVVKALRPGDTGVVVTYRGNVITARSMIPAQVADGFVYPKLPEHNFIDRHVFTKLQKLNIVPSDLSSDSEFLRRVSLDLTGRIPAVDRAAVFLGDTSPDKRAAIIEELLVRRNGLCDSRPDMSKSDYSWRNQWRIRKLQSTIMAHSGLREPLQFVMRREEPLTLRVAR
jgi:hypothetical protein